MITCHKCGRDNEDRYKFCLGCGASLQAGSASPASGPGAGAQAGPLPALARSSGEATADDGPPTDETPRPDALRKPAHPGTEPGVPAGEPGTDDLAAAAAALTTRHDNGGESDVAVAVAAPRRPAFDGGPRTSRSGPHETVPSVPAVALETNDPDPEPAKAAPEGRVCTSCGSEVPEAFLFCGRCGTRYEAPAPAAATSIDADELEVDEDPTTIMASPGAAAAGAPGPDAADTVGDDTMMTSPVRARLVLIHPDGSEGDSIALVDGQNTLGRESGAEVLANDEYLSSVHVAITCTGNTVRVEDLGSANGVYLRLADEPIELRHDDLLRIGQELLRYSAPDQPDLIVDLDEDETLIQGGPVRDDVWGALHLVVAPGVETNVYVLEGNEQLIGREVGNILFREDGFVSGRHARLAPSTDGSTAWIKDLDSSNGTYIRLREPYQATDGDFILLGQQLFHLHVVAR